MNPEQWKQLDAWCSTAAEKVFTDTKARQISKFQRLTYLPHQTPEIDKDRVVRNLSSRPLTEEEKEVLALGLNFAVTPKQIPALDIIAATEVTASHLDDETAQQLRLEVSSVFSSARPPKDNLSGRLHKAIRDLKRDKDIIILPADKGSATVVMDQSDYTAKMDNLLGDPAYKKLKRNPTTKVEAQISAALKELEQKGCLTNNLFFSPSFSSTPQIYGLPKIHKEGIPLRPIVSAIGSPTHRLARELVRILSPLEETTASHVKNSTVFVNRIGQLTIQESETSETQFLGKVRGRCLQHLASRQPVPG